MLYKREQFLNALRSALGKWAETYSEASPQLLYIALIDRGIICNECILAKIRRLCMGTGEFNNYDADDVIRYINNYLPKKRA